MALVLNSRNQPKTSRTERQFSLSESVRSKYNLMFCEADPRIPKSNQQISRDVPSFRTTSFMAMGRIVLAHLFYDSISDSFLFHVACKGSGRWGPIGSPHRAS